jgi:branched-chain amino acid transport system permease protein
MMNLPAITLPERARGLGGWLACGAGGLLVAYVWFAGGYLVTVLSFALIYAIFVSGLNVFMGFTGQVSFGQNAFAAISGYASAVLTATYGMEPLPAFLLGFAGALLCALLVGYPTLRLKGHYLAMATLAVGLIVYEIAIHWQSVTQGYMGISGIPPLGIGRYTISSERSQLLFLAAVTALMLLVAARIRHSRLGRAFVAVAGPLVGAVVISLLPELFRQFKDYQDLVYGAALILLLIYAPRGLSSLPQIWRGRARTTAS